MTDEDFEKAVNRVLAWEGGYTNDEADSGGPTNFGITLGVLEKWRERPQTAEDVKNLTVEEAKKIYKAMYWLPLACDKMEKKNLASAIFDQGVNCGVGASAVRIQRILAVAADARIGPKTLAALNACDEKEVGRKFAKESCLYYASIVWKKPSQSVFILGWMRRGLALYDLFV